MTKILPYPAALDPVPRQMGTPSRSSWLVRIAYRRTLHASIIAAYDQGVHLPNVKVGFQRLKGQKRIEMIH